MGQKNSLAIWSIVLLLYGAYTGITYYVFNSVYYVQPKPFIDEEFHIPQAKRYCNGTFDEWDPMITTLPGVYLLSVGVIKPLSYILSLNLCTSYVLRLTNLVANTFNCILLYLLLKKILYFKVNISEQKVLLSALNMAIFPPLYFFSFLYYTEPVSTMLVLLAILLHLYDYFITAALIGLVSVVARQTNIVWIALLGLDGIVFVLNYHARLQGNKSIARIQSSPKYIKVIYDMVKNSRYKLRILIDIVKVTSGYILVFAAFCAFMFINGGIVVGDKQHHTTVIHVPQLFYFTWFYLFFTSSFNIVMLYPFCVFVRKYWKTVLFLTLCFGAIVYFNTLVHPYLLADNRHYTFYVWNKIYQRYEFVRYALIPIYLFGGFCIYNNINHLNFINQLGFIVSTAACLVPQRLLDVRYFILPFLLLRLQTKGLNWWQLVVELIFNVTINIVTVYIFLTKTFYWSDSPELQRIIW